MITASPREATNHFLANKARLEVADASVPFP